MYALAYNADLKVLQSALDSDPSNPKLYLQQLDLALHTAPLSVPAVVKLLDTAQAAEGLADKHKLLFAQRKVEFLQDFGPDIAALEEAELKLAEMQKKKVLPNSFISRAPGHTFIGPMKSHFSHFNLKPHFG